jgi:hypothetical protein
MTAKPKAAPMHVYNGQVAIGVIFDHGPGRIEAFDIIDNIQVRVGEFPTRRDAIRAIGKTIPVHSVAPSAGTVSM